MAQIQTRSRNVSTLAFTLLFTILAGVSLVPVEAQVAAHVAAQVTPLGPGSPYEVVEIGERCPEFRWVSSEAVDPYEAVAPYEAVDPYEAEDANEAVAAYAVQLADLGSGKVGSGQTPRGTGGSVLWTLVVPAEQRRVRISAERSLEPGRSYAWTLAVRGPETEWTNLSRQYLRVARDAPPCAATPAEWAGGALEIGETVSQSARGYIGLGVFGEASLVVEQSSGFGGYLATTSDGAVLGMVERPDETSTMFTTGLLLDGDDVVSPSGLTVGWDDNPGLGQGLYVNRGVSGPASLPNHVAAIVNRASHGSADVLALKIREEANAPNFDITSGNNFITFFDEDNDSLGAIQGDGAGGVTFAGPGNDYAEWLPRLDPAEVIEPGDVVGVHGGKVTRRTEGADLIMAVSRGAVVTGGYPGEERLDNFERIAFVGQVDLRVDGPVSRGDLVVPSSREDGTAVAFSPDRVPLDRLDQVVGQAWNDAPGEGLQQVTVLVGLVRPVAVAASVRRAMRSAVEGLEQRVEQRLEQRLEQRVERQVERRMEERLAELADRWHGERTARQALEARLTELEALLTVSESPSVVATDLGSSTSPPSPLAKRVER